MLPFAEACRVSRPAGWCALLRVLGSAMRYCASGQACVQGTHYQMATREEYMPVG